jgi:hypothetical protein
MVKRHAKAVETFIKQHRLLQGIPEQDNFLIVEFSFSSTSLSGAMEVEENLWVSAFSTSIHWAVSEDGPGQH